MKELTYYRLSTILVSSAMMPRSLPILAVLLGLVVAQTPGSTPEVHPTLQTWQCTKAGGCVSKTSQLVLDALAHTLHQKDNPTLGCIDGNVVNKTICPDEATCAQNCIIEGISDYSKYGVTTNGSSLLMKQLLDGRTVSPRVYLLEEAGDKYEMLQLTGREFSFDIDSTKLPCGMNGALYLSEMEAAGGRSENNTAGAT
jgi:cellulase